MNANAGEDFVLRLLYVEIGNLSRNGWYKKIKLTFCTKTEGINCKETKKTVLGIAILKKYVKI